MSGADLAKAIADSGMKSVSELWKGVSVFGSIRALSTEDTDRDETHYLLIPVLSDPIQYAIYIKRVLPSGVGAQNSLPKARVFHLPEASAKDLLEQELVSKLIVERQIGQGGESDMADLLEKLADDLDRQTEKVSGGLLLIGGVVAVFNPLVGVGIAAKALLPSMGAKASKAGAGYVGEKLRSWQRSKDHVSTKKQVEKEVKKLKPEVFENPLIRSLDIIAMEHDDPIDPFLESSYSVDAFEHFRYYAITLEGISEVYRPFLGEACPDHIPAIHYEWLTYLTSQSSLLNKGE